MISTLIKTIMMLILILLIMVGGLVIFDWLGLVSLRQEFAPVLRVIGLDSSKDTREGNESKGTDLNDTRLRQQLESLDLKRKNLDELEKNLIQRSDELNERELQITRAEELLQEQLGALEERENLYLSRKDKLEQIARNFSTMPPAEAVAQMNEMDALLVVDMLRTADRLSAEEGSTSLSSYWISQMPPKRGAEINQLLIEKP